jgi:post-segregation antitoxin (ccd killing protein)
MSNRYPHGVREPLFAYDSPKQTVSLTINSDLFARAKAMGLNASRIAEDALASELEKHRAASLLVEIKQDVAALDAFVEKHGSFAAMMREHYRKSSRKRNPKSDKDDAAV